MTIFVEWIEYWLKKINIKSKEILKQIKLKQFIIFMECKPNILITRRLGFKSWGSYLGEEIIMKILFWNWKSKIAFIYNINNLKNIVDINKTISEA